MKIGKFNIDTYYYLIYNPYSNCVVVIMSLFIFLVQNPSQGYMLQLVVIYV